MSEWLFPGGVAVAALALTYLFCLRPMTRLRRRTRGMVSGTDAGSAAGLDRALDQARTELARLHAANAESGLDRTRREGRPTAASSAEDQHATPSWQAPKGTGSTGELRRSEAHETPTRTRQLALYCSVRADH